jgi:hypothetical protein
MLNLVVRRETARLLKVECSNAVCSYFTPSKFIVCYLWFWTNVGGSQWGICFVMFVVM